MQSYGVDQDDLDRASEAGLSGGHGLPLDLDAADAIEARLGKYSDSPGWALRGRGLTPEAAADYEIGWDAEEEVWVFPVYAPPTDGNGLFADSYLTGFQCKPAKKGSKPWCSEGAELGRSLFGYNHRPGRFVPLISGGSGTRFILVESPVDAALIHSWGYRFQAVATYGADVSDDQLELLRGTEELVTIPNDDDAGDNGIKSILKRIKRYQIDTMLEFNDGTALVKDPGGLYDYYRRGTARAKAQFAWGLEHARKRA
jgi:hypothetical protein